MAKKSVRNRQRACSYKVRCQPLPDAPTTDPLPALTHDEACDQHNTIPPRSSTTRSFPRVMPLAPIPSLGRDATFYTETTPILTLTADVPEIQGYRFCYPEMTGAPPHESITYCPHTAATITVFCATVFPINCSGVVASLVISFLVSHKHSEMPPPHYPARPLVPLKICSLNKRLQYNAGHP